MKSMLLGLVLVALMLAGCQSDSKRPPSPPPGAMAPSPFGGPGVTPQQLPPGAPPPPQGAYVMVQGQVRNPYIRWTEGLTLAQAIVQAEYFGFADPHEIVVVRQGVSFAVDPRHLLRGLANGVLEPGDLIVIRQ